MLTQNLPLASVSGQAAILTIQQYLKQHRNSEHMSINRFQVTFCTSPLYSSQACSTLDSDSLASTDELGQTCFHRQTHRAHPISEFGDVVDVLQCINTDVTQRLLIKLVKTSPIISMNPVLTRFSSRCDAL